MDLDAIPLGLHDYEMWLFGQIEEVLYISHLLHVRLRRKIVYIT